MLLIQLEGVESAARRMLRYGFHNKTGLRLRLQFSTVEHVPPELFQDQLIIAYALKYTFTTISSSKMAVASASWR